MLQCRLPPAYNTHMVAGLQCLVAEGRGAAVRAQLLEKGGSLARSLCQGFMSALSQGTLLRS